MIKPKNQLDKSGFHWIALVGAVIVLACFFIPWVKVSFGVGKKILSGLGFAGQDFRIWFVPVMAGCVIVSFFLNLIGRLKWFRIITAAFGFLGLVWMVFTYLAIEQELGKFFVKLITSHRIEIGFLGTVIGFIIICIVSFLPKRKSKTIPPANQ